MFGCGAIHGGVGVSGFGTWVEGLETAWGVKIMRKWPVNGGAKVAGHASGSI